MKVVGLACLVDFFRNLLLWCSFVYLAGKVLLRLEESDQTCFQFNALQLEIFNNSLEVHIC